MVALGKAVRELRANAAEYAGYFGRKPSDSQLVQNCEVGMTLLCRC